MQSLCLKVNGMDWELSEYASSRVRRLKYYFDFMEDGLVAEWNGDGDGFIVLGIIGGSYSSVSDRLITRGILYDELMDGYLFSIKGEGDD